MRRVVGIPLAAAVAILAGALPAHAQFRTPEDGIRALYKMYGGLETSGFRNDAANRKRFFTRDLAKLWARARNLEYDFFVQAQDFEITDFKVSAAEPKGNKTSVVADFINMKEPRRITYDMERAADGWRIADAKYGRDTLRAMLRAAR